MGLRFAIDKRKMEEAIENTGLELSVLAGKLGYIGVNSERSFKKSKNSPFFSEDMFGRWCKLLNVPPSALLIDGFKLSEYLKHYFITGERDYSKYTEEPIQEKEVIAVIAAAEAKTSRFHTGIRLNTSQVKTLIYSSEGGLGTIASFARKIRSTSGNISDQLNREWVRPKTAEKFAIGLGQSIDSITMHRKRTPEQANFAKNHLSLIPGAKTSSKTISRAEKIANTERLLQELKEQDIIVHEESTTIILGLEYYIHNLTFFEGNEDRKKTLNFSAMEEIGKAFISLKEKIGD